MAADAANPMLSSGKTSDSRLAVQLHPLVILTISDYITRHILREQKGPIVGAILGAQNGRDITMEHAFECKLDESADGQVVLHPSWFHERLQQYRDVHKAPALDLVGWFTLTPSVGPQPHHLPIHNQLLEQYNESALLLAFHPSSIADGSSKGGKLPLTIYESVYEVNLDETDSSMQEASEATLRFHELPYTVETGEAEMIGVDFVARGGARAEARSAAEGKGKKRAAGSDESKPPAESDFEFLSAENENKIAILTSKANAIRMLQQRVSLLKKYLQAVPPCYLNDATITTMEPNPDISHTILRSMASLLARLPLVTPTTRASNGAGTAYEQESATEASDVALVSLLGSLGSMLEQAQSMGRKASIVESRSRHGRGGRFQIPTDQGIHMDDEDGDSIMEDGRY